MSQLDNQFITVLGATGSVGVSTLEVIGQHSEYSIFALSANTNVDKAFQQCLQYQPRYFVMVHPDAAQRLLSKLESSECNTRVLSGADELVSVANHPDVTCVMAAIVGAAGLLPTLAAVESGKKVLLANKESLVMAGELFMDAVRLSGATLLPIDSEHNAIFQCLPPSSVLPTTDLRARGVRKVILTASGGPFREISRDELGQVTPEQACNHPNWEMGRKISVDSATMMNKGLELIEACFLFGVDADQVEIVIHPQSLMHSMVEYVDGSIIAQLGSADMRVPIAYALAWPRRMASGASFLDLVKSPDLQFHEADLDQFPCLRLGREAANMGSTAPAILNAANEVAVQAFLEKKVSFLSIPDIISKVMSELVYEKAQSIDIVLEADRAARQLGLELIERQTPENGINQRIS